MLLTTQATTNKLRKELCKVLQLEILFAGHTVVCGSKAVEFLAGKPQYVDE